MVLPFGKRTNRLPSRQCLSLAIISYGEFKNENTDDFKNEIVRVFAFEI